MKTGVKIVVLSICLTFSSNSANCQTLLGLRATSDPNLITYYQDLNAKVSRQIRRDYEMTGAGITLLGNQLQSLKNIGVTTIVCLRFPNHPSDIYQMDRVPSLDSTDMANSLALVDSILINLNGKLDYFQLQNEPLAGPGKYIDTTNNLHYGYYAIEWLDTLGKHVRNTIQQNNLNMGIISPAFHDVDKALLNTIDTNSFTYILSPVDTVFTGEITLNTIERFWYRALMRISKLSSDIIDVHLNVDNISSLRASINNLDSLQTIVPSTSIQLPYSSLEWSQANEKKQLINQNAWMQSFLDSAYQYHVDINVWNNFIDSLNFDTTFMQEAYCVMDSANFIHACYAGLLQFGSVGNLPNQIFSSVALLTNSTVDPISPNVYQPNEPFYTLFKSITTCSSTTNIDEQIKAQNNYLIFPNPTNDRITIQANKLKSQSIKVYNTLGQDVSKLTKQLSKTDNSVIIDLSNLANGIYILKTLTTVNKVYKK